MWRHCRDRNFFSSSLLSIFEPPINLCLLDFVASYHGNCINSNPKLRDAEPDNEEEDDDEHRIHLYKSRGQHILKNPRILDRIVQKAGVLPTDTVLEIGPGTGNLTFKLLDSAHSVVAVEIDPRMVDIIHRRAHRLGLSERLTVIREDALKTRFPPFDLCVSNIPYNISSPLLAKFFFSPGRYCFRSATLLLQKEFAKRLLAEPGDSEFNRLAVNIKLVATVEHVMDVSKRDFVPNPRVDSSIVTIHPRLEVPQVDLEEWWAFTQLCFGKKNKTLGAIFRQKKKIMELACRMKDVECCGDSGMSRIGATCGDEEMGEDVREGVLLKERIIEILKSGGFEDKRPSKLSHDELLCLLSLFNQDGIHFHKRGHEANNN